MKVNMAVWVMVVLSSVCFGQIETFFYDDFENVPAATLPSSETAYPAATAGLWMYYETSTADIRVINNAVPGPAGGGSNYLYAKREAGPVYLKPGLAEYIEDQEGEIQFDLYIPSAQAAEGGSGMFFVARHDSDIMVIRSRFLADGTFIVQDSEENWLWVASFTLDSWINARFHNFDFENETFDFSLIDTNPANTVTVPGLPFHTSGVTRISELHLHLNEAGAEMYVDNVVVSGTAPTDLGPTTVIFADNFADADAVTFPASGQYDPVAQIGEWKYISQYMPEAIQVVNNAVPGALVGTNYLRYYRAPEQATTVTMTKGNFEYPAGPQPLVTEFNMYFPTPDVVYDQMFVYDVYNTGSADGGPTNRILRLLLRHGGGINYWNPVSESWGTLPTTRFPRDVWVNVKCELDFNNQEYVIRVNGFRYGPYPFVSYQQQAQQVSFAIQPDTELFIDDVSVKGSNIITMNSKFDLSGDGVIDMADFAIFSEYWLECNLEPQSLCY